MCRKDMYVKFFRWVSYRRVVEWRHRLGHEEAVAGWSLYVQIVTYHSYRL
jgi:hypothetical protein